MPGNACNLKCRICNAEQSSLWAKDFHKLFNPDVPFKGSQEWEYNKNCQWIDDPKFIESLNSQTFKDLEYLHLLGGEPLMVVKHYEILQKIIDAGYAKNIQIEYNTNGTHFFSKEQLNILSQFKKLAVNMSIDDIGSRFEYQRKNGVWADVWENIKKFYALQNNFVSDPNSGVYDAIVLAVKHKNFIKQGATNLRKYGKANHVFFDLKYAFNMMETDERL